MGARQLKRDVEALIGDYIGQKLRENSFDPKGKGTSTMLDDLQLSEDMQLKGSSSYPNRLEREAMILSSFAGIIMVSAAIVYPFTLSYHPFAMLGSYKAVHHSRKHSKCTSILDIVIWN
uniref:Uncharacterized protein n=1 Tax=Seriola lalandi dorsalis TaxID=1841481 RepID=A0A3B4Y564_SERLL